MDLPIEIFPQNKIPPNKLFSHFFLNNKFDFDIQISTRHFEKLYLLKLD